MNKTTVTEAELKARVKRLEHELQEARIHLENHKNTLLVPAYLNRDTEHQVTNWDLRGNTSGKNEWGTGTFFSDESEGAAFAQAIGTMLLLRQQPGTRSAYIEIDDDTEELFMIVLREEGTSLHPVLNLEIVSSVSEYPVDFISPAFISSAYARRAIDTIGMRRVANMFCVLHGLPRVPENISPCSGAPKLGKVEGIPAEID